MVLSETIKVELIYTDLEVNKVGLFSKIQEFDTVLQSGDRIEICRP